MAFGGSIHVLKNIIGIHEFVISNTSTHPSLYLGVYFLSSSLVIVQ